MPRFVVLRHDTPAGPHWDFMLELAGSLRTWALQDEPTTTRPIAARGLPDHRLVYLDYEGPVSGDRGPVSGDRGPVSGDRGTVSQYDAGTFDAVEFKDDLVVVRLAGRKLIGRAMLEIAADSSATPDDNWQFRFTPE